MAATPYVARRSLDGDGNGRTRQECGEGVERASERAAISFASVSAPATCPRSAKTSPHSFFSSRVRACIYVPESRELHQLRSEGSEPLEEKEAINVSGKRIHGTAPGRKRDGGLVDHQMGMHDYAAGAYAGTTKKLWGTY